MTVPSLCKVKSLYGVLAVISFLHVAALLCAANSNITALRYPMVFIALFIIASLSMSFISYAHKGHPRVLSADGALHLLADSVILVAANAATIVAAACGVLARRADNLAQ